MPVVSVLAYRPFNTVNLGSAQVVTGTLTIPVGGMPVVLGEAAASPGTYVLFVYGAVVGFANLSESNISSSMGFTVVPGSLTNDTVNKWITVAIA